MTFFGAIRFRPLQFVLLSSINPSLFLYLGPSSDRWYLHSRPLANSATFTIPELNTLLTPMTHLLHANDDITRPDDHTHRQRVLQDERGEKISPRSMPLGKLPGMPIMQYQVTPESLELVGMVIGEK